MANVEVDASGLGIKPKVFRSGGKIARLQEVTRQFESGLLEPTKEVKVGDQSRNEAVFTSTTSKLAKHVDRVRLGREEGEWHPVNLQISPTDRCNLECNFCSTWGRQGDEIPIYNLKKCIDEFMEVGPLMSAEVTGGGDPTVYPDLEELIHHLGDNGLDIGMISNGLLMHRIDPRALERLTWVRVSLSYLDAKNYYGSEKDRGPKMVKDLKWPEFSDETTVGFSYVWTQASSDRSVLDRIVALRDRINPAYIRIVPNCQNPLEQEMFREKAAPMIAEVLGKEAFSQTKDYGVHDTCRIGALKPFLNSDGVLYHCSAVPLYKGYFTKPWDIGPMSEVKDIWPNNFPEMETSNCADGKCFYVAQNRVLDSSSKIDLTQDPTIHKDVPHWKFV